LSEMMVKFTLSEDFMTKTYTLEQWYKLQIKKKNNVKLYQKLLKVLKGKD
jgi:hypothetical protein